MIGAWAAVIVAVFLFGGVTDRPWLVGVAALLALVTAVIAGAGSHLDLAPDLEPFEDDDDGEEGEDYADDL